MARIALYIHDTTQRMTLKALLEKDRHTIVGKTHKNYDIRFSDIQTWRELNPEVPTILLASATEIPEAVEAMSSGIWGYIFVPFQPHEACIAVNRALKGDTNTETASTRKLQTMQEVEFEQITQALKLCNGNQAKAARMLNIGRNTLWRKLKKMEQENHNG